MKLVIQTQYCENYGDENKPYWKFKGGSVYIVPNLTDKQADKILTVGIPTLKELIGYKNPMSEEYVTDYRIVEDDAVVCDEWENPYILSWENNTWVSRQVEVNNGSYRRPVASKIIKYTMGMNGERMGYECSYAIEDGRVVSYKDINDIVKAYEKA